jgi:hypothetical protein
MNRRASGSKPPSRRSASVCARDGGACIRSPAGFPHGRGDAEISRPGWHLDAAPGRPHAVPGSSSGGGCGTVRVGVGAGVDCAALGAKLAEGLGMLEAARQRSSTASTTPTAPTSNARSQSLIARLGLSYPPLSRYRRRAGGNHQTRRSRPHMWFCSPWPCAALSKVHNRSPATLP